MPTAPNIFSISGAVISAIGWDLGCTNYRAQATFPDDAAAFQGHFPGEPIVPGFLLLELVPEILGACGQPCVYASIEMARFLLPVRPREVLHLQIILTGIGDNRMQCQVMMRHKDQLVSELCAVLTGCQNG